MSYRIDHRDCFHDNTQGARARCRRERAQAIVASQNPDAKAILSAVDDPDHPGRVLEFSPAVGIPTYTPTTQLHCENCGVIDPETRDSYTTCCNELVCGVRVRSVWGWSDESTGSTGTIEACCAARITMPHDMMIITHREI